MRKWSFTLFAVILLTACSQQAENKNEVQFKRLTEVNKDVQSLIDFTADDKFASVIYSETKTSYLLINAAGEIDVSFFEKENDIHIDITHTEDSTPEKIEDIVYSFNLAGSYDKIHLYENGEEIPFEVWYE